MAVTMLAAAICASVAFAVRQKPGPQYVLRDSPEWTREKIQAAMNGTSPTTVTLKNHIRVFFVYGTALATEQGNVLFFDDIYGHDQRLEEALNSRRPRSAAATRSAAP
jgi:murein L,D-transpeptidase YcbB/YkuD